MKVIAVIPAYKSPDAINNVVSQAAIYCHEVIVVDDCCPEGTGRSIQGRHDRSTVIFRDSNGGVGAATKTGVLHALELGADIIVKLDSDGQMDPSLIPALTKPLQDGSADFSKGTRFDSPEDLEGMPRLRMLGNAALSLINKFSSGYWSVNDPTNGFIAFNRQFVQELIFEKISDDYFFESDLLFRARLIGARISQMRMTSVYGAERSGLRPLTVLLPFFLKHLKNLMKRLAYMYLIREWNLGTIYVLAGGVSLITGLTATWSAIAQSQVGSVGTGTAVLASLGYILWVQFTTAFLTVDVTSEPR